MKTTIVIAAAMTFVLILAKGKHFSEKILCVDASNHKGSGAQISFWQFIGSWLTGRDSHQCKTKTCEGKEIVLSRSQGLSMSAAGQSDRMAVKNCKWLTHEKWPKCSLSKTWIQCQDLKGAHVSHRANYVLNQCEHTASTDSQFFFCTIMHTLGNYIGRQVGSPV